MPAKSISIAKGSPLGSPSSRTTRMLFISFMLFAFMVFLAGLVMLILAWKGGFRKENRTADAETKVIVVTSSPTNDTSPPVYPKRSPDYPLRQMPQDFQQVGVLVDPNEDKGGEPTLLALFGRKMSTRDRWEYYVASDKFHMWKLPVQVQKRMCDHEYGCEEIYNGDQVIVPDYGNRVFTARIYAYSDPSTGSRL